MNEWHFKRKPGSHSEIDDVSEPETRSNTLDRKVVESIIEVTSQRNIDDWTSLCQTLYDIGPSFTDDDATLIMKNCIKALDPQDGTASRVVLRVMCYLSNFCHLSRVGFESIEFGHILIEIMSESNDATVIINVLDLIERFCSCWPENNGGPIVWAYSMELSILKLFQSPNNLVSIRPAICAAAAALLRFCDVSDSDLNGLFHAYLEAFPDGDFALVYWLEGLRFMMKKWPFLYEQFTPEVVQRLLDSVIDQNPKVPMLVLNIVMPLIPKIADELVQREIISKLFSQREFSDSALPTVLVHFLSFTEALTRVSPRACKEFVDRQGFSFATLYTVGFKAKLLMVRILNNVCMVCPVPSDEISKRYISDAVESALDADDEDAVLLTLSVCGKLLESGYSLNIHEQLESLATQDGMPKVGEAAQRILHHLNDQSK